MRLLLCIVIWAALFSLTAGGTYTCLGTGPAPGWIVLATFLNLGLGLLVMIAAHLLPRPMVAFGSPPRRPRLTTRAMVLIPAWGLVFTFILTPWLLSAFGAVARWGRGGAADTGLIILGAALVSLILFLPVRTLLRHRFLIERGEVAQGAATGWLGRGQIFEYTFRASSGAEHVGRCRSFSSAPRAGETIAVYYDPTIPGRSVPSVQCFFEPSVPRS